MEVTTRFIRPQASWVPPGRWQPTRWRCAALRRTLAMVLMNWMGMMRMINGHFRNPNWRYLPYIRPIFQALISGNIPAIHMAISGWCSHEVAVHASKLFSSSHVCRACADSRRLTPRSEMGNGKCNVGHVVPPGKWCKWKGSHVVTEWIVVSMQSDTERKVKNLSLMPRPLMCAFPSSLISFIQCASVVPRTPWIFSSQNAETMMHAFPCASRLNDLVTQFALHDSLCHFSLLIFLRFT